jgi:hypothetical protein
MATYKWSPVLAGYSVAEHTYSILLFYVIKVDLLRGQVCAYFSLVNYVNLAS